MNIKIDKKLDKFKGKVLFPKKLALAEELLQRAKFRREIGRASCRERV